MARTKEGKGLALASLVLVAGACCTSACSAILDVDDFGPLGATASPGARTDGGARTDAGGTGGAIDGGQGGGVRDAGVASDCPGTGGPVAVRIPTNGAGFCIDTTEVTRADYARFLASGATPSQPGLAPPNGCGWNTSLTPSSAWPPSAAEGSLPVGYVDWCDAYAFCAWSGKRLCGRIGGGPGAPDKGNDASRSAWYAACSQGGARRFPYGASFEPRTCNGPQGFLRAATPVASLAECEGGYPGIFDMSGNVREWEDSCTGAGGGGGGGGGGGPAAGASDTCNVRGGGFDSPSVIPNLGGDDVACDTVETAARATAQASIGIRCCSP